MQAKRTAIVLAVLVPLMLPTAAGAHPWPTWGNDSIPDCTFAAAANWEIAALGYTPSEERIKNEYFEAARGEEGLSPNQFSHWWLHHGIGGVYAKMREVSGEDSLESPGVLPLGAINHLKRELGLHHYLLAHMGWDFGHEILLTGDTPQGPTYVSWGEERQMTWLEWREQSWGLFIVAPSAKG